MHAAHHLDIGLNIFYSLKKMIGHGLKCNKSPLLTIFIYWEESCHVSSKSEHSQKSYMGQNRSDFAKPVSCDFAKPFSCVFDF